MVPKRGWEAYLSTCNKLLARQTRDGTLGGKWRVGESCYREIPAKKKKKEREKQWERGLDAVADLQFVLALRQRGKEGFASGAELNHDFITTHLSAINTPTN
jgi:hypothetical protein